MPIASDADPAEPLRGDASSAANPADSATLQTQLAAERERSLRLTADFDNFRKRTARDSELRAATQKDAFIRDLLPVIDSLERALAGQVSASSSSAPFRTGIELTFQQLLEVLRGHGVKPDEDLGGPFDPHRQEAIQARFDPGRPDHIVLEVVQRGYRRGEVMIRPAKVIINDLSLAEDEDHGS